MTLPNFIVLGAAKCGTTSLYYYLGEHPQVYMSPVKEPGFFCNQDGRNANRQKYPWERRYSVKTLEAYEELFQGVKQEIAMGEASVGYLPAPETPARIHALIPAAKLIAVLRDPTSRLYSGYMMRRRRGEVVEPFAALVRRSIQEYWDGERDHKSFRVGFYRQHLDRYYAVFPAEQIKVMLFDDLKADARQFMQNLYEFLCVDLSFKPYLNRQHNKGVIPRSKLLHNALIWSYPARALVRRFVPYYITGVYSWFLQHGYYSPPSEMTPELRAEIIEVYREEILRTQDLLKRDLSAWLEVEARAPQPADAPSLSETG